MGWTILLAVLSVFGFTISFFQVLVKRDPDKKRWGKLVALATSLLIVNTAAEIGKRIAEKRHDDEARQRQAVVQQKQAEQLALTAQIHSDVAALNKTAAAAFERLEGILEKLPPGTRADLTDQARILQIQLRTVADAGARAEQDGRYSELRALVLQTRGDIERLSASIDANVQEESRVKSNQAPPEKSPTEQQTYGQSPGHRPGLLNDGPKLPVGSAVPSGLEGAPIADATSAATRVDRSTPMTEELIEEAGFVPSGFMGDASSKRFVRFEPHDSDNPHSQPDCQKVTYIRGTDGWAAIAWQFPANNWGDYPGKDWSRRGFTRVTVWARARRNSHGTLPIIQFKAGGHTDPGKKYKASFEVSNTFALTEEWKQYSLDLTGKDLSQVIAAFVLVLKDSEGDAETVFLDDIAYR